MIWPYKQLCSKAAKILVSTMSSTLFICWWWLITFHLVKVFIHQVIALKPHVSFHMYTTFKSYVGCINSVSFSAWSSHKLNRKISLLPWISVVIGCLMFFKDAGFLFCLNEAQRWNLSLPHSDDRIIGLVLYQN